MALPGTAKVAAGNLDHIYFLVNKSASDTAPQAERSDSLGSTTVSRSVSPGAGSSDGSSGCGSSSSSNSALNPKAAAFQPMTKSSIPPPPTASRMYELREIDGKGLGLFATGFIPIGTCIISEASLLRISENALHLVWGPYCKLSNAHKKAFDALHLFKSAHLHLEQTSRVYLIDRSDSNLGEDDIEELVQQQVRVMGTFACNNFQCGGGLGVFETTSRLNHSCVPNVHHSWNPTLKKQTVYAARDIQPGEELCTTYLGGPGAYYVRAQRIESMRNNYGFTCTCVACSDPTGQSDGRRELMGGVAYGLQVFQYGGQGPEPVPYVPTSPVIALKQAEDFIYMLIEEGILSIELCKAYRMASMLALGIGDYEKAREYAFNEAEVEKNCLGTKLYDLVKSGAGAACWMEEVRKAMVNAGVLRSNQKLKKPKTEEERVRKRLMRQKKAARKLAEEEAQEKEVKATEKKAKSEAQSAARMEEERKLKEYEAAFPDLKA